MAQKEIVVSALPVHVITPSSSDYIQMFFNKSDADRLYGKKTDGSIFLIQGAGGGGVVNSVAVDTVNGFSGNVIGSAANPVIQIETTVSGILFGNGTSVSAAAPGDFPTLNQNTTGNAATASALNPGRTINGVLFDGTTDIVITAVSSSSAITLDNTTNSDLYPTFVNNTAGNLPLFVSDKFKVNPSNGTLTFQENTNTGWNLYTRSQVLSGLNIPVPVFRPNSVNTVLALDLTPNGTPIDYAGQGITWIDICDTDEILDQTNGSSTRIGMWTTHHEIGTRIFGTGTAKPLLFTLNNTTIATMNVGNTWTFNQNVNIIAGKTLSLSGSTANGVLYNNALSVVTTSPNWTFDPAVGVNMQLTGNGDRYFQMFNTNAGAAQLTRYIVSNGTNSASVGIWGTGFTPTGLAFPGTAFMTTNSTAMIYGSSVVGSSVLFIAGPTSTTASEILRYTPAGLSILTRATPTAYVHIASSTGAPNTGAIKFINGTQLVIPESLVLEPETGGANLLFTNQAGSRFVLAKILTATATLNFDLTALNSQDLTMTVTGAASGDPVALSLDPASVPADITYFGWVSAVNTITVRCSRVGGGGAVDPASGTFRAFVFKP